MHHSEDLDTYVRGEMEYLCDMNSLSSGWSEVSLIPTPNTVIKLFRKN